MFDSMRFSSPFRCAGFTLLEIVLVIGICLLLIVALLPLLKKGDGILRFELKPPATPAPTPVRAELPTPPPTLPAPSFK
jgi:hypothetical protein